MGNTTTLEDEYARLLRDKTFRWSFKNDFTFIMNTPRHTFILGEFDLVIKVPATDAKATLSSPSLQKLYFDLYDIFQEKKKEVAHHTAHEALDELKSSLAGS